MVAVEALATRLRKEWAAEQVLLFGSRARGDHLLWSDVDLLVVSPRFEGVPFTERMMLVRDLWTGPVALEALCYTPAEWRERRHDLTIAGAAAREGKAVG